MVGHSPETKRVTHLVSDTTDEPQGRHLLGSCPNAMRFFLKIGGHLVTRWALRKLIHYPSFVPWTTGPRRTRRERIRPAKASAIRGQKTRNEELKTEE